MTADRKSTLVERVQSIEDDQPSVDHRLRRIEMFMREIFPDFDHRAVPSAQPPDPERDRVPAKFRLDLPEPEAQSVSVHFALAVRSDGSGPTSIACAYPVPDDELQWSVVPTAVTCPNCRAYLQDRVLAAIAAGEEAFPELRSGTQEAPAAPEPPPSFQGPVEPRQDAEEATPPLAPGRVRLRPIRAIRAKSAD